VKGGKDLHDGSGVRICALGAMNEGPSHVSYCLRCVFTSFYFTYDLTSIESEKQVSGFVSEHRRGFSGNVRKSIYHRRAIPVRNDLNKRASIWMNGFMVV